MFERFTDGTRTAMRLAVEHARSGGSDSIDTADVLLGLIDAGGAGVALLDQVGGGAQAARERLAARPDGTRPPSVEGVRVAADMRAALEGALRECLALSQWAIEPEHLLLGIVGVEDGAAVALLRPLGADLDALRRSARQRAAETYPRVPAGSVPVEVPALGPPPVLPAGRALALWYAVVVPVHLLLCVPVVALAPADERVPVGSSVLVLPLLALGLYLLIRPAKRRRLLHRLSGDRRLAALPATALAEILRPYGISDLRVYLSDEAMVRNTAWGLGRHGFIRLARVTLRVPDVGRFVTAHEAGHIARRDGLRLVSAAFLAEGLLFGGLVSARPVDLAVGLVAAVVLHTGAKWSAELSSDAIAVRWVGLPTATVWYRFQRRVRQVEPRNRRWYLRHSIAWLHHPPLALRYRCWSRAS